MAKLNLAKKLPEVAALGAGAVGANLVTNFLPADMNDKIKAAIPLALGVVLSNQKGLAQSLGNGMIAAGVSKLVQSFGIGNVLLTTPTYYDRVGVTPQGVSGQAGYYDVTDSPDTF